MNHQIPDAAAVAARMITVCQKQSFERLRICARLIDVRSKKRNAISQE